MRGRGWLEVVGRVGEKIVGWDVNAKVFIRLRDDESGDREA